MSDVIEMQKVRDVLRLRSQRYIDHASRCLEKAHKSTDAATIERFTRAAEHWNCKKFAIDMVARALNVSLDEEVTTHE